ncbi:MAG: phosphomannomutase [Candidatus Latescibacterota bacterium]|nr:MAG: phosphomannomutase [Candidatus Latescibacterota bacterium]
MIKGSTSTDRILIADLMERSGVRFGTSGARGLVTDMSDRVCYAYTAGFIQYLESTGELSRKDRRIAVAGDYRSSTDRIMTAVGKAVIDRGYLPVNCGKIPSPAVALYGIRQRIPAIMVTGSHIPDDRNGIKYNKGTGEILKFDETGIKEQTVVVPDHFSPTGMFKEEQTLGVVVDEAHEFYVRRWLDAYPSGCLAGKSIGVYEHSAVGRDLLYRIYTDLGAEVTQLGRAEKFVPVDTEAIRPEDVTLASEWMKEHDFDTIVSTDGDGDRPLISDERGRWIRGDVAGILTAQYLGADVVVTPVSCNTAVEKSGLFQEVRRTGIGSPYVIEEMDRAVDDGARCVVGYEANGGFLTASSVPMERGILEPLPTRDPVVVHLSVICLSIDKGLPISELLLSLPQRYTASDRLKEFPQEKSRSGINELITGGGSAIEEMFPDFGSVKHTDTTDGLRITFDNDEILHLRPSGNAPELRCYTEAASESRAWEINRMGIRALERWRGR